MTLILGLLRLFGLAAKNTAAWRTTILPNAPNLQVEQTELSEILIYNWSQLLVDCGDQLPLCSEDDVNHVITWLAGWLFVSLFSCLLALLTD